MSGYARDREEPPAPLGGARIERHHPLNRGCYVSENTEIFDSRARRAGYPRRVTKAPSRTAARYVWPLLVLAIGGCAHTQERLGDARMAAGEPVRAVDHWEAALGDKLMDYEVRRIQAKRRQALAGIYTERIEDLRARYSGTRLLRALVDLRAHARSSSASVLARFDEVIAEEIAAGALQLAPGVEPKAHLLTIVGLHRDMASLSCPEEGIAPVRQAIREATYRVVDQGGVPVEPRLRALFEARIQAREARLPPEQSRALEDGILVLGRRAVEVPSSEAELRARFSRWLAIDEAIFRELVPRSVIDVSASALARMAEGLVRHGEAAASEGRFSRALELTELALRGLPRGHAGRQFYADLRAGVAALALDRASTLSADRAALVLVLRGLARHFGAEGARFDEAKQAAAPLHVFHPVLRWEGKGAGCDAIHAYFPARFSRGETVTVRAEAQCVDGIVEHHETRAYRFQSEHEVEREEQYQVRVPVTRYRTEQRQCTKPSSLDGYVWTGLCDYQVPYTDHEYETRTRIVTVIEAYEGQQEYVARVLTRRAGMQGRLVATTEEGASFAIPIQVLVEDVEDAYDFLIPPEKFGGPPRRIQRSIPGDFTMPSARAAAAERIATVFHRALEEVVQTYRAELAMARGRAAQAAGDLELAGHELARAALHVGRLDRATEPYWLGTLGVDLALVEAALFGAGVRPDVPSDAERRGPAPPPLEPLPPIPSPEIWIDTYVIEAKGFDRMFRGHDSGSFRARAFTYVIPDLPPRAGGEGDGDRYAPMIGLSYHLGALQYLVNGQSGWGPRIFDEVELGLAGGVSVTEKASGENRAAYMFTARYLLGAGVRTHHVSLFGGMRVGANYLRAGHVRTAAFHLDPFVRLAIRTSGPAQIVLYLSGFQLLDEMHRVDTAVLRVPIKHRIPVELVLTAERFHARMRAPGGHPSGGKNMGERDSYLFGAGIGTAW